MRISIYMVLAISLAAANGLFAQVTPSQVTFDPSLNGTPLPMSLAPINDGLDKIQFAIMSDRTGGMIPGVFRQAAGKVNQLQPQFVMSVGDLIDGYTYDSALVMAQWQEFTEIVDTLEVPFFYVPGNHDISNDFMEQEWAKRYGQPYYYFRYKDALFLCLHTEDSKVGDGGISAKQLAYFNRALAQHTDVRWTFVFMHRPLWSYGDQAGFEGIEALLAGRTYTLFSAHHHHYYMAKRNGQKHFILATTGGGSYLRGSEFGEFHHITWVTLTEGEPKIINIALDGLIAEDVVNETIYPIVQSLRMGDWLQVHPFVAETRWVDTLRVDLTLTSTNAWPLQVHSLALALPEGYRMLPSAVDITLPPKHSPKDTTLQLTIYHPQKKVDLQALPMMDLQLTGQQTPELGAIYRLPTERRLVWDWLRPIYKQDTHVDGDLLEWHQEPFIELAPPEYLEQGWDWHGASDAQVSFQLAHDQEYVYLAAKVVDDVFRFEAGKRRDKFMLWWEGADGTPLYYEVIPDSTGFHVVGDTSTVALSLIHKDNQLLLEMAVPRALLQLKQDVMKFNLAYFDHDNPQNTKPSKLFWKPRWGSQAAYEGQGRFRLTTP